MGKGNVKKGVAPVIPKHEIGSAARERGMKGVTDGSSNLEGQIRRLSQNQNSINMYLE